MEPRSFVTSDVDEANAISRRFFYQSRVDPVPRTPLPFRYSMTVNSIGPITYGIVGHGCEIDARAHGFEKTYGLGVPLKGVFSLRYRNEVVRADPFTAALQTPTTEVAFRGFPTGTEQLFLVAFDREAMDSQLRKMVGRDDTKTIQLEPSLDLRTGRGAQWWRLASTLVLALQSPNSLASNPLMATALSESLMTSLLLAANHPYRDDLDAWTQVLPPIVIRRARSIIESRAHEPLTITDIAAEIGCSLRTLQVGYRRHYDMTPHEHLIRVRLDRAHTLLQAANPTTATVAEIAALCGFGHPGRFAIDYRKTYGVQPNITLRNV